MRPHNLTLVMIGAGLLWFGWFGFNAGSALGAGNTAAVAWINTMAATAAASLAWIATEKIRDGHATSLGAASGVVAGLVAITPACSAVNPVGAILVGADRRRAVRPGREPEVQVRLRRLARRRRCPPGRRRRRHAAHRHPGHRQGAGRRRRAVLRRRLRPALAAGRRGGCRAASTPSSSPTSSARSSTRRWASGSTRTPRSPASTSRATPSRPTSSVVTVSGYRLARPARQPIDEVEAEVDA